MQGLTLALFMLLDVTAISGVAMLLVTAAGVRLALRQMLAGPAPITALFCGNNRASVAALRELRELAGAGEFSGSLAFVGFDDFELADLLSPGITVVAQDVARLGRAAAELLFRRLAGDRGPVERIEVTTRLIQRGSGEIPPVEIHDRG
jgi:LacI family transcriptional regulator